VSNNPLKLFDPLKFQRWGWPHVTFYDKQVETCYSIVENVETVVVAGNMLGKDYVAGYIVLLVFLSAIKTGQTCRILTTSVAERHLKVLWGEIGRWVTSCKHPLLWNKGGPLVMNHMQITRASERQSKNPINYIMGKVCEKDEGFSGHHADVTLGVVDEASGVEDGVYNHMCEWAKRMLIFGNPHFCQNFFNKSVEEGSILKEEVAA
jgi:hypothetical protein